MFEFLFFESNKKDNFLTESAISLPRATLKQNFEITFSVNENFEQRKFVSYLFVPSFSLKPHPSQLIFVTAGNSATVEKPHM